MEEDGSDEGTVHGRHRHLEPALVGAEDEHSETG
jgi:hypothetical protein